MKLMLFVFLTLFGFYSYAQFEIKLKRAKVGLLFDGEQIKRPKYDSIVLLDEHIATAYKNKRIYYINALGEYIYNGLISGAEPFQANVGIVSHRFNSQFYYQFYLIDNKGEKVPDVGSDKMLTRIGNLVYIEGYSKSLYFGTHKLEKGFDSLSLFYNWVIVKSQYKTTETVYRRFRKNKLLTVWHDRLTYYNIITGKQTIYNSDESKIYGNVIYLKNKEANIGGVYFKNGNVILSNVTYFEEVNDNILFFRNSKNGIIFDVEKNKIIVAGNYKGLKIEGDYFYCEKTNPIAIESGEYSLIDVYNLKGDILKEDLKYVNRLINNRSVFYENDSVYIGTLLGDRLSDNYYDIGGVNEGYRVVYSKYSYSYINDSTYQKLPIELPLIMIAKYQRRKTIFHAFAAMIGDVARVMTLRRPKSKTVDTSPGYYTLKKYPFVNGLAIVPVIHLNDVKDTVFYTSNAYLQFNYLKPDGTLLNKKKYDYCMPFVTDTTWVEYDDKYFPINKKGKKIGRLKFDDVRRLSNGYYIVKDWFDYGVVSPNLKLIIPCKYKVLEFKNGKFYAKVSTFDEEFIELEIGN